MMFPSGDWKAIQLPGADIQGKAKAKQVISLPDQTTICIYLCFVGLCSFVWQCLQRRGLSTLPTFSVGLQVLATIFLELKIYRTRNAAGISAKSLILQATVHALRLSSTIWRKGYLPNDETGKWLYQTGDLITFLMCLHLLYSVRETYRHSYQADADSMSTLPIIVFCSVLAIMVHPDLNNRFLWDTTWAASLYVDVVAMLPQLWMLSKIGGNVEAMTGHYVATVAFSRMVNLIFWYHGYKELAPLDGGFNFPGYMVLLAHLVQSLLMFDFLYFYFKGTLTAKGVMVLPGRGDLVDI